MNFRKTTIFSYSETVKDGRSFSDRIRTRINYFKSESYYYQIDVLRGVAALMVVMYHFILGNPQRFQSFSYLKNLSSYGHLGVQVFFVISGFVIPSSMMAGKYQISRCRRYLLKRITRLEPPYIISVLLCIVLIYLSQMNPYFRGKHTMVSWPQVLLHLGYLNAFFHYDWFNVVYWTLAIEFQYYLLMAFLYPLIDSDNRLLKISMLTIFYVLAFSLPQKELFFRHAPYFIFGVILFQFKSGKILEREILIFFLINFLVCFLEDDLSYATFAAAAFAFILVSQSKSRLGVYLGSISYSLYLLHVPIGQRILNLSENFIHNPYAMLGVVFLCMLFMVLVSHIYFLVLEKPFQRLSKGIVF
jgi:peptidoglycan/LPS O-acetylase OafA/YrhL